MRRNFTTPSSLRISNLCFSYLFDPFFDTSRWAITKIALKDVSYLLFIYLNTCFEVILIEFCQLCFFHIHFKSKPGITRSKKVRSWIRFFSFSLSDMSILDSLQNFCDDVVKIICRIWVVYIISAIGNKWWAPIQWVDHLLRFRILNCSECFS